MTICTFVRNKALICSVNLGVSVMNTRLIGFKQKNNPIVARILHPDFNQGMIFTGANAVAIVC